MREKLNHKPFYLKTAITCFLFLITVLMLPNYAYAAESFVTAGTSEANASYLNLTNNSGYYSTQTATDTYFYFTTPSNSEGYTNIYYKNTSMNADSSITVYTKTGNTIYRDYWLSKNQYSNRNYKLESNCTYYIKINCNATGNFLIYLDYQIDAVGNDKTSATSINLNQEVIGTIDGSKDADVYTFTASHSGYHYIKYTNTSINSSTHVGLYKYTTEERLWYENYVSCNRYTDTTIKLEKGQKYYIVIDTNYSNTGTYTFTVNNQNVSSISLNASQITLERYEEYTLVPTISPSGAYNKNVDWSTSDSNIVSVNREGVVYARTPGMATIYCTSKDGSKVTASCQVYVRPDKVSYVSSEASKNTSKKVNVYWERVYKASGYTIYSYDTKKKTWSVLKDNINPNTYQATLKTCILNKKQKSLSPATTYKYAVAAYVKVGNQKIYGARSESFKIATAPSKVTLKSVSYKRSKHMVTIKWKKVSNATGYIIYYKPGYSNYYSKIATIRGKNKQSFKYRYYSANDTYKYKVVAYKQVGNYISEGTGTTKKRYIKY